MASQGKDAEKIALDRLIAFVRGQIARKSDQQRFLRAIQPKFLENLDPIGSGFLDFLYSQNVINARENSSICGRECATRRMKARKLFVLLNKVPVGEFRDMVVPELCSTFPHIVNSANFDGVRKPADNGRGLNDVDNAQAQNCLRHTIVDSRITPTELSDILYHQDLMDIRDYGTVSEDDLRKKDQAWATVLTSMERTALDMPEVLASTLQCLLVTYCLTVPPDLRDTVRRGLPCACRPERHTLPSSPCTPKEEVAYWLERPEHEGDSHRQTPRNINNTWSTFTRPKTLLQEDGSDMGSFGPQKRNKRTVPNLKYVFHKDGETVSEETGVDVESEQQRSPGAATTVSTGASAFEQKPLLQQTSNEAPCPPPTTIRNPNRRFQVCKRSTFVLIAFFVLHLYCAVLLTVHVFGVLE